LLSNGNLIYKFTATSVTQITVPGTTLKAYSPSLKYIIVNNILYKYSATTSTYTTYLSGFATSNNYKIY